MTPPETELGRVGAWLQTASGRRCWPLDPRPEEISIEDIAHALALVCRFGGHCREHYSVAQHSTLVATLVEESDRPAAALHALLHDAAEAYVGDVVRGIKPFVYVARGPDQPTERFVMTEARVARTIAKALGLRELGTAEQAAIIYADDLALATEARDLMGAPDWPDLPPPDPRRIVPIEPAAAEREFLACFRRLTAGLSRCRNCGLLVDPDDCAGHYDRTHDGTDERTDEATQ